MVLDNEKIANIVETGMREGFTIRVRDISFVLLSRCYEDKEVAYKSLFGKDDDNYNEYVVSDVVKFVESKIPKESYRSNSRPKSQDEITFEQNKAEIISLIKQTQDALANKEIEVKDALKIEADLRVKLNDKFSVNDTNQEQLVIVTQKYDDICPYCSHEISRRPISKEEAKEMYKLVEKD